MFGAGYVFDSSPFIGLPVAQHEISATAVVFALVCGSLSVKSGLPFLACSGLLEWRRSLASLLILRSMMVSLAGPLFHSASK